MATFSLRVKMPFLDAQRLDKPTACHRAIPKLQQTALSPCGCYMNLQYLETEKPSEFDLMQQLVLQITPTGQLAQ
jgi:hypothetical protein